MTDDHDKIIDGTVWNEFCDTLKMAGNIVLGEGTPDDALNRAEGFRYLSRIVRAGLETFVEHKDPRAPVLRRVVHETVKMGADNPDNFYEHASISGEYDYRLTGNRGSVNYLGFYTQAGHYGQGRGMPPTGFLEAKDLEVAPDGTFELTLSTKKHPGNWLPMTADTGSLIIRQTFLDRENEVPAQVSIERIRGDAMPTPFDPATVGEGLATTANLVVGAGMLFASWVKGFKAHTNQLPRFDQALSDRVGGDPNIAYYHSYWEVQPDEALVIEATPPACDHWNFQLNNYWMESLDYRYYPIHVNKHTAKLRPDGSVSVVVAHENRGFDNWINTVGHTCGTMCWRWVRAKDNPEPRARLVKLSEL